jgi:ABC-type polysaccharide/polyol phosphate export permease
MPLGVCFWVIMVVWFVFGLIMHFGVITGAVWGTTVSSVLLFVLFGILGWQVFGPAIHR